LGNLGGVMEILILGCSAVCFSVSEYSFTLTAVHKFFNARTRETNLFVQQDKISKYCGHDDDSELAKELAKH
jgi:hypothetical protein